MASSQPQSGAPGSRRGLPSDLAADVRATAQAAQELGPQYHDALAESLADKVEAELRERRLPVQPAESRPPAHQGGTGPQLALAIVSLGVGIPLTAIAANAGGLNPLIGILVVWLGIVLVNLIFNGANRNR
jgi:Flp pilus assembly protein TadB